MNNRSRDYGLDWERELVRKFKNLDDKALRTPGSGAFGTRVGASKLQGDVLFRVDGLPFLIEAKAGYGGSKSITVKREWLDKAYEEAINQKPTRIPLLALKLKGGKTHTSKIIALTLDDFYAIMEKFQDLVMDLNSVYNFLSELKEAGVDVSKILP